MTTKRLCIHLLLPSHQILRPWSKPHVFDFASNIPLHEPHLRPGRVTDSEYAMLGLKLDDIFNWSICHSLNADAHTLQSRCRHLHRVVYLHQKDPVKVAIPSDCHAQNFLISSASFLARSYPVLIAGSICVGSIRFTPEGAPATIHNALVPVASRALTSS